MKDKLDNLLNNKRWSLYSNIAHLEKTRTPVSRTQNQNSINNKDKIDSNTYN